jgi:hypothetical protein
MELRERLAADDRGNTEWQRDLSVSNEKVGDVLVAQGKLDEAVKACRNSLAIRERLAALDRSNSGWQRNLRYTIGRIGSLAYRFVLAHGRFTHLLSPIA